MTLSQTSLGRLLGCALLLPSALALTACSSDYPTAGVSENGGNSGYVPPPAPAQTALAPASSDPIHDSSDPLGGDDPLQAGDDPIAADHSGFDAPDPLATNADPLGTSPIDASLDRLSSGPTMPTDHSHWLDGTISSARVAVALNHVPYGVFETPIDKDITMHLRRGVNIVTFKFTPEDSSASTNLQIEESEHTPPIPPLVVFRPPLPLNGETPQPLTQTYTFIAH